MLVESFHVAAEEAVLLFREGLRQNNLAVILGFIYYFYLQKMSLVLQYILFFQLLLLLTVLNYLFYSVSPIEIVGKKTYKEKISFHVTRRCFSSVIKLLGNF